MSRPIRLRISDDLRRSRLTVFFRLFLTIPHFFWLGVWTFAIVFTAFAQWVVTVVRGRPAGSLNDFHAAFVRYTTHVGAYLALAANPFPGFLGTPGYPVDVEVEPAERQGRIGALFRLVLAIPAWFLLWAINFGGVGVTNVYYGFGVAFYATAVVAGLLAWFASLVLGRMPLGLRNLIAYGLRYTSEVYAYSLLLTPVYPSSDPSLPAEAGELPHPIRLEVADDRQRSRLTTFFRLFLTVPHFVWLTLWWLLALPAAVAQWLVALVTGRPAAPLHRFLAAWVRYQTHVFAFLTLVANPFPGFTGRPGYPVDVAVGAPDRQRRLVTLFRLFLALPALLLQSALAWLLYAVAIGGWFAALAIGRMPLGLRNAGAHALRYNAQVLGYTILLTDRYPFSGPPAQPGLPETEEPADALPGPPAHA